MPHRSPTLIAGTGEGDSVARGSRLSQLRPLSDGLSLVAGLFLVFGVVVRARQFGARRSLWLDEAMIGNNLLTRTIGGLLHPLANHQGAPLGWLVAEKGSLHVFGANEYALRAPAFVAGILVLPLMWVLARQTLPPALVPLAVAAVAISPQLIRYSSETKPYGSDALAVLLVVVVAVKIAQTPLDQWGPREALAWAVTGAVVVLCSFPGVVTTVASSIVLVSAALMQRRLRAALWLAGSSAVVAGVLLFHYIVIVRALTKDVALKAYWHDGNPPRPLAVGSLLRWLGRASNAFIVDPVDLAPVLLVAVLIAVGAIALFRRDRLTAVLITIPVIAQVALSIEGASPFSGRLALGYVPLILLIIVAAATAVPGRAWAAGLTAAVVIGVLTPGLFTAIGRTANPLRFHELRPIEQRIAAIRKPGDLLFSHYVFVAALQANAHLGVHLASNGSMYARPGTACPDSGVLTRAGTLGHRVWFIGLTQQTEVPIETAWRTQSEQVFAHLRSDGAVLADLREPGTEAILVDLPAIATGGSTSGDGACLQIARIS